VHIQNVGLQNVGLQNVGSQNVDSQNVDKTKRRHFKTSTVTKRRHNKTSTWSNSFWTGSLSRRSTLYTILEHIIQKDSWAEQVLREEAVGVGGNALEAAKSRSKQREQRHLDLQAICVDVDNTTPTQYMERLVGVLRE
jgi:hypothetical protein